MGTFHDDKGELHGITIVVETAGPRTYVGRCFEETDDGVLLLDVDYHDSEEHALSREEYLARAAKFGTWKKLDRHLVPRGDVTSIRRLAELAGDR
ncbi:MAG: hypothetical protein KDC38_02685 [Planctomycetes bacterium]|nr:hypothetical protein [Planctomycetota bacterium]